MFRLQRLEESLKDEPEEQKSEKRAQHAVKETEFLRLKRSKLGVDDFDPIKVIGRGAFGEVRQKKRKPCCYSSLKGLSQNYNALYRTPISSTVLLYLCRRSLLRSKV